MQRSPVVRRALASAVVVAWMAVWFWTFSFAFSDSFFTYNRHSRLPVFAAAWVASGTILWSAWLQWRRRGPILRALLRHAAGAAGSVALLVVVSAVLARAPDPWHPSADDAMGTGIDFLMLSALGVASLVALGVALGMRRAVAGAAPERSG